MFSIIIILRNVKNISYQILKSNFDAPNNGLCVSLAWISQTRSQLSELGAM